MAFSRCGYDIMSNFKQHSSPYRKYNPFNKKKKRNVLSESGKYNSRFPYPCEANIGALINNINRTVGRYFFHFIRSYRNTLLLNKISLFNTFNSFLLIVQCEIKILNFLWHNNLDGPCSVATTSQRQTIYRSVTEFGMTK